MHYEFLSEFIINYLASLSLYNYKDFLDGLIVIRFIFCIAHLRLFKIRSIDYILLDELWMGFARFTLPLIMLPLHVAAAKHNRSISRDNIIRIKSKAPYKFWPFNKHVSHDWRTSKCIMWVLRVVGKNRTVIFQENHEYTRTYVW